MAKGYTAEERQAAGRADLFLFIQFKFPNEYIKQGNSIRLKADHSVCIKRGYSGFMDFSKGTGGSGVDLLMQYWGYGLTDAVRALAEFDGHIDGYSCGAVEKKENAFVLPEKALNPWRVKRYLTQERGISESLVGWLLATGLLFEDSDYHNCCFLNHDKDFCEFRGTYGTFHKVQKRRSDGYWFMPSPNVKERPKKGYICESSIDCLSLYELLKEDAFYFSLAGVGNYGTIQRIRKMPLELILAVDGSSDDAANRCRKRFVDMECLLPEHKDWNIDLLAQRLKERKNNYE